MARTLVIVGDTPLARSVCASLAGSGAPAAGDDVVRHLMAPSDAQLRQALSGADALAVLLHDDHAVLRYTLAAAHGAPAVPIVASIFDRTVAGQLTRLIPWCELSTPGNLVAPSLAGPCLAPYVVSARADVGPGGRTGQGTVVVRDGDRLVTQPWAPTARERRRMLVGRWSGQLRPTDAGSRILLGGLLGLLVVLLADIAWLTLRLHEHAGPAFFDAARVVATVGPASPPEQDGGYLVFAALAMLATIVLTAAFTAGVVERLMGPRLVGLVGRRALPHSGHVVVVGLGQVGLRLCQELRGLGVPVVAVERSLHAPAVRLARSLRIPVVIGEGEDRSVLERVGLQRARAVAAVGSDDLDNVAVAVAAHAVAPGTRVVLRAGAHEAISETRSLLPLGTTRDVTAAAAAWVVARLTGERPGRVVADVHDVWLDLPDRGLTVWPVAPPDGCTH